MAERSLSFDVPPLLDDVAALELVTRLLSERAFRCTNEAELQTAVHGVLREHLRTFGMLGREVPLSKGDRIDFLIPTHLSIMGMDVEAAAEQLRNPKVGGLGIELKVDGSLAEVARQVQRYLLSDKVTTLVLVTTLRRHRPLDGQTFNGKPVHVVRVAGGLL